ncbi:MAG: hypothetical protein A2Y89_02925 [Chloroflexi bacterium RBG_13_51_18]|nr:MAG: hypothetical protein A2Y89_02925 [Chloroflexi bacterium RBG_13_51_18]
MPAKSKHGRGKQRHGKKKSKFRQAPAVAGLPQETSSSITKPEAPLSTAPVVKTQVQKKAAASAALPLHYEFISGDLKRIGILTGIIIVLLIVAYYIFS